jgi:hypothetical protein
VQATFATAPAQPDGSSAVWNNAVLQWNVATADWGNLVGIGLFDAQTNGVLLVGGPLAVPKTVNIGDAVRFSVNTLLIGMQ